MLSFSLLGSGSSGNAVYIATETTAILIDNGLSYKQLEQRLACVGAAPSRLQAVLVTHEHGDHVKGVGILARKVGVPVYCTPETHAHFAPTVGTVPTMKYFEAGEQLRIGDLDIGSFPISHDAADPVSFVVRHNGAQLGLATDLGKVSNPVRIALRGAHTLVLEANHCPDMLRKGSYPPAVQQRIRGRLGHLSNQDMCSLLAELVHEGLRRVVLIHLSEENNCPNLVRQRVAQVLNGHPAEVVIATQDAPTPLLEVCPP